MPTMLLLAPPPGSSDFPFLRPCQIVSLPLAGPSFLFYELKVENIVEL